MEDSLEKFKKPYDAASTEPRLYKEWEESGFFNPDNLPTELTAGNGKPYTIVMPPPNANGSLHAGHALFITMEDLFTRFKRMQGYKALWIPGADHAGFETQVVYEKQLEKEGRSRFGMDPQQLYAEIMEFTLKNKVFMEQQIRDLGASCDWSREKFTLDPDVVKTVQETFLKMYQDELIYRGMRIVNWCSKHQTSLSDVETESIEEKGKLYYFKYGPFEIATARPETKFGDKYVVMHPEDERYAQYKHGDKLTVEWINGPLEATIIKSPIIDMAFGTGVMTITPWHSQVDFELAKALDLDMEQIIDFRGKLLPIAQEFAGMKISEAREKIVEKLASKGLVTKIEEDYSHVVKHCYKCNTVIEPQVKDQWFVKMAPLARLALEASDRGEFKFIPEYEEKTFRYWMENTLDWNISRQIVWGIPIPAHFCATCETPKVGGKVESKWFIVRHGQTELNFQRRVQGSMDSPLTEEGRAQIHKAGEELAKHKIDLIISSDLGRAKETSEILAQETGAEIIYDAALRERSYGPHEGKTYEEVDHIHHTAQGYNESLEGIEAYVTVEERAWSAFSEYRKTHRAKNVVIVSHGGVIRALKKRLYDLTTEEAVTIGSAANGEILAFDHLDSNCTNCGGELFTPDTDTFDTWFSSGQWPLITTADSPEHYPTDVMETGRDLVFKWIPRMIIFGLYLGKKSPFHTIYLHGLVNDSKGKKMSKSKGNVISPLELTSKYGTDALRMALIVGNTPGTDLALSEDKVKGYKHFANKLWNIARFILENTSDVAGKTDTILPNAADSELWQEFTQMAKEVTDDLESYRVYLAAEKLYHYAWHRLADEIIESSKAIIMVAKDGIEANDGANAVDADMKASRKAVLRMILVELLKLLHPFMPFVTEEIWQSIPETSGLLMVTKWPV
jgi:valyl-tRNA synthetase